MRIEQRIGRVHRLGQTEDVHIYNLSTLGTIEEHILRLLHEKINMFEMVIGELDTIVEAFENKEDTLEKNIYKMILESKDDQELKQRIDHLGSELVTQQKREDSREERRKSIAAILDSVAAEAEVQPYS